MVKRFALLRFALPLRVTHAVRGPYQQEGTGIIIGSWHLQIDNDGAKLTLTRLVSPESAELQRVAEAMTSARKQQMVLTAFALILVGCAILMFLAPLMGPLGQERMQVIAADGFKTALGALVGVLATIAGSKQ